MAKGYDKEFLIDVYLSRFLKISSIEELCRMEQQAIKLYDCVGKDEFRTYATVTPARIKKYQEFQNNPKQAIDWLS